MVGAVQNFYWPESVAFYDCRYKRKVSNNGRRNKSEPFFVEMNLWQGSSWSAVVGKWLGSGLFFRRLARLAGVILPIFTGHVHFTYVGAAPERQFPLWLESFGRIRLWTHIVDC